MTEKQQIEELYNLLAGCHSDQDCTEYINCDECKAKLLVKQGHQKVDESSVVVNKEYLKKELQGLELQARKETAKEILKWLINTGVIDTAPTTTKMYFKEQFGVEEVD